MVYVLFLLISTPNGAESFQYEFKDRIQCEKTLDNMEKRWHKYTVTGYCQEVRK